MAQNETLWDVRWSGPFSVEKAQDEGQKSHYVLYQLMGQHHLYGANVLLYIGRTARGIGKRVLEHEGWISEEYDEMQVRVGSVSPFVSWSQDPATRQFVSDVSIVGAVESLLIYAHQPAYNKSSKKSAAAARGYRVFNTGKIGSLHPEVSYLYMVGSD